ncbi:aa3-type cytochrome c oxidase subunit IV [Acuticoccus mangrovi]|uniref:Aa3-type cytochrome c oxidase subunit IV n=1 Tax=Acuticoccus mangrovi TaxID=2796142 RepID=A0A934MG89_9HYPH|nr:aa3-type cytochrome c oxidase subunit IV [Acuticoccus mangrovi]MBJ3775705.1 aa3-type cytochrome c oxidase subunit IV [Acuticoccus mangrovi]
MANTPEYVFDTNGEPPRSELADHMRTYEAFLSLMKWGIILIALLLIGMAVFLL